MYQEIVFFEVVIDITLENLRKIPSIEIRKLINLEKIRIFIAAADQKFVGACIHVTSIEISDCYK